MVSGIGYRVSGIRFRVSGIGYQVSGIRFRVTCHLSLVTCHLSLVTCQGRKYASLRHASRVTINGNSYTTRYDKKGTNSPVLLHPAKVLVYGIQNIQYHKPGIPLQFYCRGRILDRCIPLSFLQLQKQNNSQNT